MKRKNDRKHLTVTMVPMHRAHGCPEEKSHLGPYTTRSRRRQYTRSTGVEDRAARPGHPGVLPLCSALPGRHTYLSKLQQTGLAYLVHSAVREPKHKAIHNKDHLCQFTQKQSLRSLIGHSSKRLRKFFN